MSERLVGLLLLFMPNLSWLMQCQKDEIYFSI